MKIEEQILKELADDVIFRIVKRTIKSIKKNKEIMLNLGGSILKNAWEEFCVQVQGEETYIFKETCEVIIGEIEFEFEKLQQYEKLAVYIFVDNEAENINNHPRFEDIVADSYAIGEYILNYRVISEASNYTNKRINEYLGF